jgi:hypothetical protein
MYVCYADDSGHCGKRFHPDQPVQVVAGVVADIARLHKTQREQKEILDILRARGNPASGLKAADTYSGRREWKGVAPEVRRSVFDLLLDWAAKRKCRIIVSPIDTGRFFDRKLSGCDYSIWCGFPYEAGALNILLSLQRHHAATKTKNKGKTLVVFDEHTGHDQHLLDILSGDLAVTDDFTGYSAKRKDARPRLDQIMDVPHFSKSHLSIPIQLADCAAYVVRSYLLLSVFGRRERYAGEYAVIERWYKRIGKLSWPANCVDPPRKGGLCGYYKELRPAGWTPQKWTL